MNLTTPSIGRRLRYFEAVNESLRQEMARDPAVVLLGEDLAGGAGREHLGIVDAWGGRYNITRGLVRKFGPNRVIDTPISEAGFVGAAIGAAMTGLRPVAELGFVDYIGVSFDQIVSNAAKLRYMYGGQLTVPVTILTRYGAGSRTAEHTQALYSVLVHIPGLKVVVPSDAYTAKGLLAAAIRDDDPVVVVDDKGLYQHATVVPETSYILPIGRARTVREGSDVTIVGIGGMTWISMAAAELLAKEGIEAEVVDLLSLSPLDYDHVLESVRKTRRLVIVDEDTPRCGVSADIAAVVADEASDRILLPIKRVTPPHAPVPFNPNLEKAYLPNAERILGVARDLLSRTPTTDLLGKS